MSDPAQTPEAIARRWFEELWKRITVDHVVREGDAVACHCTVTGTHTGPGLGAPSKKPVRFTGITIVRARDGKLVEGWNAFDFLGCFQQIGMLPPLN